MDEILRDVVFNETCVVTGNEILRDLIDDIENMKRDSRNAFSKLLVVIPRLSC